MRNLPHKVTGDDLTADEFNDIPEEEENLITSTGQTLSAGDLHQIAKAVATYAAVGDFYNDSGSANAYVLSPLASFLAPVKYWDGMRVRFRISHTNTGPATVNVNSLGIKAIVKEDGVTQLSAGDLPIGEHGELIFHADIDSFELYSHKYQDQTFSTGDNLWSDSNADKAGWIRVNDSTKTRIGDALSGTTNSIRANADCEALFKLYWTFANTECSVIGGRGATASADWLAHKQITVPNSLTRVFASHDINNPLGIRKGQVEGERAHALSPEENGYHNHAYVGWWSNGSLHAPGSGSWFNASWQSSTTTSGNGAAHNNMQPTVYKTLYIKL